MTAKGLMNRAHAYKAAVAENDAAESKDPDKGITMGLFCYPILMSADILMFKANKVPVGKDQKQHVEMARDIAQRFNHHFGETFVIPEAVIDEQTGRAPGPRRPQDVEELRQHDPALLPEKDLRKTILKIKTNSLEPGVPKDPDDSALFSIYAAFATKAETDAMRKRYADGIGWGDMKQLLFEYINEHLRAMRAEYERLIAAPDHVEAVLRAGAEKARQVSGPFLAEIRRARRRSTARLSGARRVGPGAAGRVRCMPRLRRRAGAASMEFLASATSRRTAYQRSTKELESMKIMEKWLGVGALGAIVMAAQVGAQEGPAPVEVQDLLEITATVKAVDLATRTVTVSDGAGNDYAIEAGPEVRNLAQVKVGDEVVVSYYSALAAEFKKPGEGVQLQTEAAAARAPVGERPAAVAGQRVTATIVIDSVNAEENTVTFTGPRGLRTVAVEDPSAQAFIKQLKKGDEVEVTYTEALAISVEPAK